MIDEDKRERAGMGVIAAIVGACVFVPLLMSYLQSPARFRDNWPGMVIGGGSVIVLIGTIMGLAYWFSRRRARRVREILEENAPEPAFDMKLDIESLRGEPALLEALQGKVAKVCVMRNITGTGGGKAGSGLIVRFASFVIDIRGVAHDVEERRDHQKVAGNAEWLAGELGVELEDTSYGG